MRSSSIFRQLPVSLLLFALIASAGPIDLRDNHLPQLTPDSFADSTTAGLVFVEFYSPTCPHCIHFAPTWKSLVDEAKMSMPSVVVAQVDCAMYGGVWQQLRLFLIYACIP
jgi:thioredoxin domain-containing protein 5